MLCQHNTKICYTQNMMRMWSIFTLGEIFSVFSHFLNASSVRPGMLSTPNKYSAARLSKFTVEYQVLFSSAMHTEYPISDSARSSCMSFRNNQKPRPLPKDLEFLVYPPKIKIGKVGYPRDEQPVCLRVSRTQPAGLLGLLRFRSRNKHRAAENVCRAM